MIIDRRRFLGVLGAGAALGCERASGVEARDGGASDAAAPSDAPRADGAAPAPDAPNVLLIVVDQERASRWFPAAVTLPAHDALTRAGTTFARHYTDAMPCTPSRSVMYTGQHTQRTGMRSNIGFGQASMATSLPTLGTMLKARGYATAYLGKWHLSEIDSGTDCANNTAAALQPYGFDTFNACGDIPGKALSGYRDDPGVATAAGDWIARRAAASDRRPWLLACNFVNPHDIMFFYGGDPLMGFGTRAPDDPVYRRDWGVSLPANADDDLSSKPGAQAAYKQLYDTFQRYPDTPLGAAGLRNFINYYVNCIVDVDRHVQTVLAALARSPLAADTVVVFTSDHGEMAQAHGLRGKGPFVYEENNHVPLIVVDPRARGAAGRRVDALSCHLDLAPTVLALAGQSLAETRERYPALKGLDLTPWMRGETAAARASLLMTFDFGGTVDTPGLPARGMSAARRPFVRGVFDGRTKFARYFAAGDYHLPMSFDELVQRNDLELYDLDVDASERTNLAASPAAERERLTRMNDALNELIAREAGGEFTG